MKTEMYYRSFVLMLVLFGITASQVSWASSQLQLSSYMSLGGDMGYGKADVAPLIDAIAHYRATGQMSQVLSQAVIDAREKLAKEGAARVVSDEDLIDAIGEAAARAD